jgi:hypothetical protein
VDHSADYIGGEVNAAGRRVQSLANVQKWHRPFPPGDATNMKSSHGTQAWRTAHRPAKLLEFQDLARYRCERTFGPETQKKPRKFDEPRRFDGKG